ncbi:segregation and condensation protein A ScpA [Thermosynechococcus sp. NK55a]|jgi:segregation and condensation protein A|uniref:segregation/condensation protein A n=1 Tax=unclassified Thermosynechococcus TaxID=2622553 RepID=UPI0003D836E5|nr:MULTISPECIES: segregation/condensation protein A [unclassified Thermosynechococcus]AHB88306.1 segregation and condensation protein A ScpA [Thermosynechococcus sp. NK55a]RMH66859.1 MAG: segregation/condensation protein A [Cyanobacteria bacterium J003]HIK24176.1 segregation/condensation protein A [Thermosynechococcus sp. M3746_W2019_013]
MSQSFADTAIDILIELAERGEIDPWDIQVVDVCDRCLAELARRGEPNLSESGQAFLYAAMLVLLKSDRLVAVTEPSPAAAEGEEPPEIGENQSFAVLPHALEQHLHRRPVAPPQQWRRLTLEELIGHLKTLAIQSDRPKGLRPHQRRQRRRPTTLKAITQLAHQENLTEMAREVESLLREMAPEGTWLDFQELLQRKPDSVGVFWALLFLAAQSKVDLQQTDFYQPLQVRTCLPDAISLEDLG